MARIFLSHSTTDKPLVFRLRDALEKAKHNVWIDDLVMVGDSIPQKISDALEQAEIVILCVSKASLQSSWVDTERDVALMRQFSSKNVRLLPVRLANVPTSPLIRHFKHVDLFPSDAAFDRGVTDLLTAIDRPAASGERLSDAPAVPSPPVMRGSFVGRHDELARLRAMLLPGRDAGEPKRASLAGIRGIGGIGKTALAKVFAEENRAQFLGGILWADLGTNQDAGERGTSVNPDEVLRGTLLRWANELGRDTGGVQSRDALLGIVRNAIAESARRGPCLAILDNVDTSLTLAPLLDALSDCSVLVTTRQEQLVADCEIQVVRLGGLERPSSHEYLASALDRPAQDMSVFDRVLDYVEDHPLALKLLAQVLRAEPEVSVDEILSRLKSWAPVPRDLAHVEASLRRTFDLSFERLPRRLRAFLIATASQSPVSWPLAAADYVSGVCRLDRSRDMVAELCRLGFIDALPGGRYRIHRLLRDYLRAVHGRDGLGFVRPTWEISLLARASRRWSAGAVVYDLRQEFWFLRHARRNRERPEILRVEWDGLLLGIGRRMGRGDVDSASRRFFDLKEFLHGADLSGLKVTRVLLDNADLRGARLEDSNFSGSPLRRLPPLRQIGLALLLSGLAAAAVVAALNAIFEDFSMDTIAPIVLTGFSCAAVFRTILGGGLWFDERGRSVRIVLEQAFVGVPLLVAVGLLTTALNRDEKDLVDSMVGSLLLLAVMVILARIVAMAVRWLVDSYGLGGLARRVCAATTAVAIAGGVLWWIEPISSAFGVKGWGIILAVGFILIAGLYSVFVAFARNPDGGGLLSVRTSYFRHARLDDVKARGACFAWTRFQHATLTNADLTGADFRHARLDGVDLSSACLLGTDFRDASLQNAILKGATFDHTTKWPDGVALPRDVLGDTRAVSRNAG